MRDDDGGAVPANPGSSGLLPGLLPADPDPGLDAAWLGRAIELGARARHANSPNPMVGAIVLDQRGEPAGDGYNERDGGSHAEAVALGRAGRRARGGTLYVNLEPCAHQGRTPPCVEAVIASGVARVVVAHEDPDPRVRGLGLERLRAAGVSVTVGVEEAAARRLNRFYLKHRSTGLPYVTAKFAMTLDGRIATVAGASRWITGEPARAEAHRMREAHDAVLVGVDTVINDDPELTARGNDAVRQPVRLVVDSRLRIPSSARLLGPSPPTLIATTAAADSEVAKAIESAGAEVIRLRAASDGRVDLGALLAMLGERNITSVLVEGGATVNGSLFAGGLVDEVVVFVAPVIFGGAQAPGPVGGVGAALPADGLRLIGMEVRRLGDDLMITGECSRA